MFGVQDPDGHDVDTGQPIDEMPQLSERDTWRSPIPPPLLYIVGFLAGIGLESAFPMDGPPLAVALVGAVLAFGLWLALDGAAMLFFRRAGTSMAWPSRSRSG